MIEYNIEELSAVGVPTSAIPQSSEVDSSPLSSGEYSKQAYDQQKKYIVEDFVLREEMEVWESKMYNAISSFLDKLVHKHKLTDPSIHTELETGESNKETFDFEGVLNDSIVKSFIKKAEQDTEKATSPLQGEVSQFL